MLWHSHTFVSNGGKRGIPLSLAEKKVKGLSICLKFFLEGCLDIHKHNVTSCCMSAAGMSLYTIVVKGDSYAME